jgi:aminoglycoside N3'-acetyltransferase
MTAAAFTRVLDTLEVPKDSILFVQSSTDWIERAGFSPVEVLRVLREWIGTAGTLVMPAYPCKTTHFEYLSTRPTYDARRTPAGIGLIPEVFRRHPGVRRSLDPDFCISAEGPDAEDIVRADPAEEDPFGRKSVYERLIARGTVHVGLGVSLNTSSFIHVIDSRLEAGYPVPVYSGRASADVVDFDGTRRTVWRRVLAPDFQRLTQPSAVASALAADVATFASTVVGSSSFFRWQLPRWASWCESHARAALAKGEWPCWLSRLAERQADR